MRLHEFWSRFRKNRAAEASAYCLLVFILIAIFAAPLSPYDPFRLGDRPFLPPQWDHLMGTDDLGRDTFSRILHGTRVSLLVGFLAAAASFVVGTVIGSASGYFGGFVDDLLMRATEYVLVIPRFFLALLIIAMLGTGITKIIIVIGLLDWPEVARVVRAQFLTFKEREFVLAARVMGMRNWKIIFAEILPNAIPPAIVVGSFLVARAILLEAGLSFLGLGDPNLISWGMLLSDAQERIWSSVWLAVFPGLAISLLVLSINLVGDGINDVLNPKLKEK
ncbi:MAG TPA: ABC transporter permease [candidate division Zixibacteria bacterium]|nr:ABC transporter permease [candidate division Zixibacteria bacterium]